MPNHLQIQNQNFVQWDQNYFNQQHGMQLNFLQLYFFHFYKKFLVFRKYLTNLELLVLNSIFLKDLYHLKLKIGIVNLFVIIWIREKILKMIMKIFCKFYWG